jgi:hypothetical protein
MNESEIEKVIQEEMRESEDSFTYTTTPFTFVPWSKRTEFMSGSAPTKRLTIGKRIYEDGMWYVRALVLEGGRAGRVDSFPPEFYSLPWNQKDQAE